MRSRLLKPNFFRDEDLASLEPLAQLLFAGLWCVADRDGRLENRPRLIRSDVFPTRDDVTSNDVARWIDALVNIHVIVRYEVDGKSYLQVKNFNKHQKISPKEARSTLPAPPDVTATAPQLHSNGGAVVVQFRSEAEAEAEAEASTLSSREFRHRANDARRRRARLTRLPSASFDRFWAAYPNRTHRLDAEKAWRALDPPPDLVDQIIAAIEVWKTHRQWADRQFIPYPATWLRRRLWEDEFVSTAGQAAQAATSDTLASLRRQHEHLARRAQGGDPQAVLTLAEFERDQGPKLGIQRDQAPAAVEPVQEVAP
jgi:hypothetical protein